MQFSNILNQLTDFVSTKEGAQGNPSPKNGNSITDKIPGGLAGGALAGGLMAVLMSNKKVRKSATTVAKYGGAAALGGLAYKAYNNWKQNNSYGHNQASTGIFGTPYSAHSANQPSALNDFEQEALAHSSGYTGSKTFQLALVKAMIASAKADGAIDANEQSKISEAIEAMQLDSEAKAELLSLFFKPISIDDFIYDLRTTEQRAEAYLASCLVIELDHEAEHAYLNELARALRIPADLEKQLKIQAIEACNTREAK